MKSINNDILIEFIELVAKLQYFLMVNGGSSLDMTIDRQMYDRLCSYEARRNIDHSNSISIFGHLCETKVRPE